MLPGGKGASVLEKLYANGKVDMESSENKIDSKQYYDKEYC